MLLTAIRFCAVQVTSKTSLERVDQISDSISSITL